MPLFGLRVQWYLLEPAPPVTASPSEIILKVNGDNLDWEDHGVIDTYRMVGSIRDNTATISGDRLPGFTQSCNLKITGLNKMEGQCYYRDYFGDDDGGVCSGRWGFGGTRTLILE